MRVTPKIERWTIRSSKFRVFGDDIFGKRLEQLGIEITPEGYHRSDLLLIHTHKVVHNDILRECIP